MKNLIGANSICQVGVVVKDIDASAKRYAKIFGVDVPEVIITDVAEVAHTELRGQSTPARAKLAFFKMGQLSLELIEPLGGPSTWKEFLDQHGEGVHHLAFEIKDTDGVVKNLEAEGLPVLQRGDYTGGRYTYVGSEAALGTVVELLENF